MYHYDNHKAWATSEKGQKQFLSIRDKARTLMKTAGAASMERLIAGQVGSVWEMMACVDRLVELNELIEIPNPMSRAGQHRLFIAPYSDD